MKTLKNTYLHELNNKINKFMLLHVLAMIVCDKKANIISLAKYHEPTRKFVNDNKNKCYDISRMSNMIQVIFMPNL